MSTLADVIFSEQATHFSSTLRSLKQVNLSAKNRLLSIYDDAEFVQDVADIYRLPLVANERCGSWYIPPDRKAGSVYFKSTDGHTNKWSFSLRRLNLQLLDLVSNHGGCIIVDSTRRGKYRIMLTFPEQSSAMPDALSKTVPIWCAVMNRLLLPNHVGHNELYTPPNAVSRSEHQQIVDRLQSFLSNVEELQLDLSTFTSWMKKPLRPIWVTRDSILPFETPIFNDFTPIVLCTSSRRVHGAEMFAAGYIQGAGDDSESWAYGLEPNLFWANKDRLLQSTDDEIIQTIHGIAKQRDEITEGRRAFEVVRPTSKLYVGRNCDTSSIRLTQDDVLIGCGTEPDQDMHSSLKGRYLHLQCRQGKLGSRDLRQKLSQIAPFLASHETVGSMFVSCDTAKDLSVGIALAILCLYFSVDGQFSRDCPTSTVVTKSYIKQRLSWVMVSLPDVKPSRATLQSVNDYLFSYSSGR